MVCAVHGPHIFRIWSQIICDSNLIRILVSQSFCWTVTLLHRTHYNHCSLWWKAHAKYCYHFVSVRFSHLNLFLGNHWSKYNQSWEMCCLDGFQYVSFEKSTWLLDQVVYDFWLAHIKKNLLRFNIPVEQYAKINLFFATKKWVCTIIGWI